jgi:hypothetical protein
MRTFWCGSRVCFGRLFRDGDRLRWVNGTRVPLRTLRSRWRVRSSAKRRVAFLSSAVELEAVRGRFVRFDDIPMQPLLFLPVS